jgi:hypothetical protein
VNQEHDFEPVRGLPARLPIGETLRWQGSPDWKAFAIRVFHVRKIAGWFALLMAWRIASAIHDGVALIEIVPTLAILAGLGAAAVAMFCGFAIGIARTTVYTVTERRVVMRFGMAMPMIVNLPYSQINGAALRACSEGIGDIPLALADDRPLTFAVLWPHARPWHLSRPQPMLRCIPDAQSVAQMLAAGLAATAGQRESSAIQAATIGRPVHTGTLAAAS